jgi:hypothetical protein
MTDCAWMSVAPANADIIVPLRSELSFSDDPALKRAYSDATYGSGNGKPIPPDLLPRTFFTWRGPRDSSKPWTQRLPHLTNSGFWFVSSEVAEVLHRFDFGGCKLHPVAVLMEDRKTPLPGSYFLVDFDSWKDVFLAEHSPDVALMEGSTKRRMPYFTTNDDAAALSSEALAGADIWWNPMVLGAFFLSDRLAQALRAAGVDKPFALRRCRIL